MLETALDEEITGHLGGDKHQAEGRGSENSRNGARTKTVITEPVGPIEMPRDRDRSFDPQIARKQHDRPTRTAAPTGDHLTCPTIQVPGSMANGQPLREAPSRAKSPYIQQSSAPRAVPLVRAGKQAEQAAVELGIHPSRCRSGSVRTTSTVGRDRVSTTAEYWAVIDGVDC